MASPCSATQQPACPPAGTAPWLLARRPAKWLGTRSAWVAGAAPIPPPWLRAPAACPPANARSPALGRAAACCLASRGYQGSYLRLFAHSAVDRAYHRIARLQRFKSGRFWQLLRSVHLDGWLLRPIDLMLDSVRKALDRNFV